MTNGSGPVARIVKAATKVEPNEFQATVLSFLFVFILMAAYFILRPVRDAMASDKNLPSGMTMASIVVVPAGKKPISLPSKKKAGMKSSGNYFQVFSFKGSPLVVRIWK